MKKFVLFLLLTITVFTENLILENQTSYPVKKSTMAIQWAINGKQVDEANNAIIQRLKLNPDTLQTLKQSGKVTLTIPKNAEYFRIVIWTKEQDEPDLLTNWVDVTPNKTYQLKTDHLVPSVLMLGTGC